MYSINQRKKARSATRKFLISLGVPASRHTFGPLVEAISLVAEKPQLIHSTYKFLYPEICKNLKLNHAPKYMAKVLDKLVKEVFEKGNREAIMLHFGGYLTFDKEYLTLGEFIAASGIIVDDLVQKMRDDF